MRQIFACGVCAAPYCHPDQAIECESTHGEVKGYCPECQQMSSMNSQDGSFYCIVCKHQVNKAMHIDCTRMYLHDFITVNYQGDSLRWNYEDNFDWYFYCMYQEQLNLDKVPYFSGYKEKKEHKNDWLKE